MYVCMYRTAAAIHTTDTGTNRVGTNPVVVRDDTRMRYGLMLALQ